MTATVQPTTRSASSFRRRWTLAAVITRQPVQASGQSTSRLARVAIMAGMVGPGLFFTVMTVLGLVTPGYDSLARYGSELSIGRLGWIMIANFILFGLAELAQAAALRRTITDRASGRIATAAVAVIGAAFVLLGTFVTDPAKLVTGAHTVHGTIHEMMAVVVFFLATPIGALAMARRYRHQRGFARYCAATAIAAPLGLVATFLSGSLLGLTERITIAVIMAWLTTLAIRLYRGQMTPACNTPTKIKDAV